MKMNYGNNQTDNNNSGQKPAAIYLNNAINMKAHDQFWDIAHQIVEPVVNTCQNVDWFIVVPEKHKERERERIRDHAGENNGVKLL